uniref:ATP-binding protein n=1 Tax=uncultured Erythrobacter sp. TaxID=263913 RepID=UPI0026175CAF|nr:ATP-binding protein [uncultured Erythrobacter sp.]
MERTIERVETENTGFWPRYSSECLADRASIIAGVVAACAFFSLAMFSLSLSKFDSTLASVWVPNAAVVAFLLRTRFANEFPIYLGVFIAGVLANTASETPVWMSVVFSVANLVDIALIVGIVRKGCGSRPDMTHLPDLGRFIWAGGIAGPATSALVASVALTAGASGSWQAVSLWFLTDAMGMVLVVPMSLLTIDVWQQRYSRNPLDWLELLALLGGGMACAFFVFWQDFYPLLFLIPPITLLHAFRLGSLGTAIYVAGLAVVACAMTFAGYGPIAQANLSPTAQLHMVQAFLAANFLSGLPIAATLAGRQRILEDLATRKYQLDLLADNITDAVLRYDLNGLCTYASPSVRDVLDEDPATFIGNMATDRMHKDSSERITLAQQRLVSGESDKERFTYRRFRDAPDGRPIFIEADCAIAYSRTTQEPEAIVVSARDVTERIELELLLTRARKHAENAARAKSEFLANMSHEIRTPMNGVLGFAELVLQSELDEDQRRQTEMIVQSGHSMMMLLNDVLDLSKIEAGQISIDRTPVDLHETLGECVALHRPTAEKKGLELRFEREGEESQHDLGDKPDWVMTDGLRLRQIALNLVGNAVKFTESGLIHVSYRMDEKQLSLRVMDTGIGISNSRINSVFNPFTQGESDTSRRFGGTGLGLTISRQLAELLGGSIDVESEAGVGSCFTLTLPAERTAPDYTPAPEPKAPSLEDLPHRARILLAEDHDVNRLLVREMLERCGQAVAIAHDGNEAISMVIDSMMRGSPYDLVLMDIQMPGCDGYAATRAIRGEGIGPDMLPIIALTANAFPEDVAAARDAGMQAHLAKPLVFADLAHALQRWLPTRIIDEDDNGKNGEEENEPYRQLEHDAQADPGKPPASLKSSQSELSQRWLQRRAEAVEAVREAASDGSLQSRVPGALRDDLARIVHKLAGTAAMFGDEELGDQAAALERALRSDEAAQVQMSLAQELLELADRGPTREPGGR